MPWDRRRSEELKVDPGVVASLNDKAGEHGDAEAVEEIQFPEVEHNRQGRMDQCFFQHLENGRVPCQSVQTPSARPCRFARRNRPIWC